MSLALLPKEAPGSAVQVRITLRYGNEKALFGWAPAGSMTASMLDRGAAGITRKQIQEVFEGLKASVRIGGGEQSTWVGIETTRQRLPAVLKLVATILRQPDFPASELELLRAERIGNLEQR